MPSRVALHLTAFYYSLDLLLFLPPLRFPSPISLLIFVLPSIPMLAAMGSTKISWLLGHQNHIIWYKR